MGIAVFPAYHSLINFSDRHASLLTLGNGENYAQKKVMVAGKLPIESPNSFRNKIEYRVVETLTPNPRNARTHSKRQIKKIAASLKQFGFVNPIIADKDGMLVAGHGRLLGAKELGMTEVPVIVIDHLSEAEKRAYVLADNRIALDAGWDQELLAIELDELTCMLPDLDLTIEITGFETAEIDLVLDGQTAEQSDPADNVDLNVVEQETTRSGDIWLLGKHHVICGDARSAEVVDQLRCGKLANMIITDPPFNVAINGHVGGRGKVKYSEFAMASGEMKPKQFRKFLKQALQQMMTASDENALHYIFMDWRHVEDLIAVGRKLGLELRNICVWLKTTPGLGSFYRSAHELVVIFSKPNAKPLNNIELGRYGRNRTNVWTYPGVNTFKTGTGDDLKIHPTVKPVAMIADAIKDASKRGDIILDTFLGSGTTLLAAERTGRVCYGVEYEPSYVDLAIRRWQELTGKDAVLLDTTNGSSSPNSTFDDMKEVRLASEQSKENGNTVADDCTNEDAVRRHMIMD